MAQPALHWDIFGKVAEELRGRDIVTFQKVSKTAQDLAKNAIRNCYSVKPSLVTYFDKEEIPALRDIIRRSEGAIIGDVCEELLMDMKKEDAILEICAKGDNSNIIVPWLDGLGYKGHATKSTGDGIESTILYEVKGGRRIRVLKLNIEPIDFIMGFSSINKMHLITSDMAVSLYPFYNLVRKEAWSIKRGQHGAYYRALTVMGPGFDLITGDREKMRSSTMAVSRYVGDGHCWVIPSIWGDLGSKEVPPFIRKSWSVEK